jgi:hypothetical protein
VPLLAERARALKVKDGMELDAEMGPIVTAAGARPHRGLHRQGVEEGATLVVDGRGLTRCPGHGGGFFTGGTLFDHVTPGDAHLQGRDLRPGAGLRARADFAEAVQLVNDHEFGNGVACFTSDGNVAREFARRIRSAWWASTCRSRCRWPGTASAAGSEPVRRHARLRRRRRALLHQAEERDAALAREHRQGRRVRLRDADGEVGVPGPTTSTRHNEGVGYFEVNQRSGWRWNTAKAFLRPACMSRPNFTLWTNAQAQRLTIEAAPTAACAAPASRSWRATASR